MNRLWVKYRFKQWAERFTAGILHPLAVKWQNRYPRLFRFVILRFDPHHFRGLPLTLLLFGVLLNAFILSEVAEEIREVSRLRAIDRSISLYFFEHRVDVLAHWIYRFTRLCSSPTVIGVLCVIVLLLWKNNRFSALIAILSSLTASSLTVFAGKVYYKIPRPPGMAWYEEFSYSFPSGHATIAMAYYGLLFYLLLLYVKSPGFKYIVFISGVMFIFSMGFSRVYLGVHYLSDVLSGFAIGFIWLLFSITLLGWLDFRKEISSQK